MFNLTKRSMNHFLNFFKVKEDKDEDIIAINEHLYALSLILKYYGVDINEN